MKRGESLPVGQTLRITDLLELLLTTVCFYITNIYANNEQIAFTLLHRKTGIMGIKPMRNRLIF